MIGPFIGLLLVQADSSPVLRAARVAVGDVVVDGRLTEPPWAEAQPASGFRQREPHEGAPATAATEVRVLYDDRALYVGIIAHAGGAAPVARIRQRDRLLAPDFFGRPQFASDDAVAVLLDPFHDHRNGVLFATNPNGAEFDALLTDEGREFNVDWRAVWEVRVARFEGGWSAEFAIPFRTLRYAAGPGPQVWGLNVARITRWNNEESLWTSWSRDNEGLHRVSRAGHLAGLERLPRSGLALEVKPFLLTSGEHEAGHARGRVVAGADAKYEVRPGLTLDLTANTDFAQVDVDSQQVNLTRFDLFFPEKRDFFLENAGLFEFGMRSVLEPPPFLLFFSRRIGISDSGTVPIVAGARLTGRVGSQTLGVLNVVTDSVIDQPLSNYAVGRIKRDVGGNSYLGAMVTDLRRAGGSWNTTGGLDGSFWLSSLLNVQGFVARTAASGPGGEDWAYRAAADYQADGVGVSASSLGVGPEATADLGFITRVDLRRHEVFGRVTPRPRVLGLRKIDVYWFANLLTRWDGGFQEWNAGPGVGLEWQSGESLSLYGLTGRLRLDESFALSDSIPVAAGDFDNRIVGWFGSTAAQRALALNSSGSVMWALGGRLTTVQAGAVLTPDSHLRVELGATRTWVDLPGGSLIADLANVRLSYAFSTRLVVVALAQYNRLDRTVSANVRLHLIHRPGSDLFVVFNELRGSATSPWAFDGRTGVVKLTYLARF